MAGRSWRTAFLRSRHSLSLPSIEGKGQNSCKISRPIAGLSIAEQGSQARHAPEREETHPASYQRGLRTSDPMRDILGRALPGVRSARRDQRLLIFAGHEETT